MATNEKRDLEAARRITHWREQAGLSRSGLAAKVGVTPGAVTRWEDGTTFRPPIERIAEACGVDLPTFYGPLPPEEPTNGAEAG